MNVRSETLDAFAEDMATALLANATNYVNSCFTDLRECFIKHDVFPKHGNELHAVKDALQNFKEEIVMVIDSLMKDESVKLLTEKLFGDLKE